MKKQSYAKEKEVTITKLLTQFIRTVIQDKIVLYITLITAIVNVIVYLSLREYDAVFFLVAVGFFVSYFSKNMTVILLSAIVATFLAVSIKIIGKVREGMKDGAAAAEADADTKKETDVQKKAAAGRTPVDEASKIAAAAKPKPARAPPVHASAEEDDNETPGETNTPDDDLRESDKTDGVVAGHKPKINYASTLESAYDNLDKLMSSDAIKNMSGDTQRLASKQQTLMGNIEKLEPMMRMANDMMSKFDVGGIADKISSLQGMLGQTSAAAAGAATPKPTDDKKN